jgi:hypothetical protein
LITIGLATVVLCTELPEPQRKIGSIVTSKSRIKC